MLAKCRVAKYNRASQKTQVSSQFHAQGREHAPTGTAVHVEILRRLPAVVISVQRQMKCAEEDECLNREWTLIHAIGTPDWLDTIIDRLQEKKPANRLRPAKEVAVVMNNRKHTPDTASGERQPSGIPSEISTSKSQISNPDSS